ncbi:MAG: hypothetical protein RL385_5858, partial [Pseudomonadota bacterium]
RGNLRSIVETYVASELFVTRSAP